ncbi:MAG: SpoIID/LytB domain-containing protein, partial [Actinobacteria bacterium]
MPATSIAAIRTSSPSCSHSAPTSSGSEAEGIPMGMTAPLRVAAIVAASLLAPAAPAAAQAAADSHIVSVELVPAPGTSFAVDGRTYEGVLRVGAGDDGLVLTEEVTLDQYLKGIGEVPFSWPMAALSAQVVAARTYLAHTLLSGRAGDGASYGFDICASSACQVYAGSGLAAEEGGARWVEAVERTAGQILLYQGRPAQTVYSSSTGSRTRSNQDVWGGAALPYLQAVDSPEDGVSPFASWVIDIPSHLFVSILQREGYRVSGQLQSILVRDPGEGAGPTTIWVDTEGGTDVVAETDLKGAFNRQGPQLAPGLLPVRIGDGRRLPQALPSYTYEISHIPGA